MPRTSKRIDPGNINRFSWTPQLDSSGDCVLKTRFDPKLCQRGFKLTHTRYDMTHQCPSRRGEVEAVFQAHKLNTKCLKLRQTVDEMAKRTTKSVQLPHKNCVEFSLCSVFEKQIQAWA